MSNPGPALSDLAAAKATARREAFARRKAAHAAGHPAPAARLGEVLAGHRGLPLAAYVAMRSEIDPMPAMADAHRHGPVALPVVVAPATPLRFRRWQPGIAMADGGFGTLIPASGDWITPRVLVVPLVAFDRRGNRLGYGGGFYDRTLEKLRSLKKVVAIGVAYAAQMVDGVPRGEHDAPLDHVMTERETFACG